MPRNDGIRVEHAGTAGCPFNARQIRLTRRHLRLAAKRSSDRLSSKPIPMGPWIPKSVLGVLSTSGKHT